MTQICTGVAIKAGMDALEEFGGRIMVFSASISSVGIGKVTTRSKAELFNTPDEAVKMMSPENEFYTQLGKECIDKRITVDLFLAITPKYPSIDVATLAPVCGITGGDLFVYQDFDIVNDADKLYYQVFRNMTKIAGIDCTAKMRTSTGITACEYIGSFSRHQSSDLTITSVDCDKVISCLFRNDEKLNDNQVVHC